MKQCYSLMFLGLCLAGLGVGCGRMPHSSKDTSVKVIGVSLANVEEPWLVKLNTDLLAAAEGRKRFTLSSKDAQNDNQKQSTQLSELIQEKVSLIIVVPQDPDKIVEAISAAYKQGIPVVVVGKRVAGEDFTCFLGAESPDQNQNVLLGTEAFNIARKIIKGKQVDREIILSPAAPATVESEKDEG